MGQMAVDNPSSTRKRAEERVQQRMFVRLYPSDSEDFAMAQTIDVSPHGARVFTKRFLEPNQRLVLRSLRGNLTSYARVAHCESVNEDSYNLGLELYNPIGDWDPPTHYPKL
jgi:hypothetical protein